MKNLLLFFALLFLLNIISDRTTTVIVQQREIHNLQGQIHDQQETLRVLFGRDIQTSRNFDRRVVMATVTAYTTAEDEGGPLNCTGGRLVPGMDCAVDPDYIPLGSKVYIPGIGVLTAVDTGLAVKGWHVDVCVGDETAKGAAYAFGVRQMSVIVMKEGLR